MALVVDETTGEPEVVQRGVELWRCLGCGYVNIDEPACANCGEAAPPGTVVAERVVDLERDADPEPVVVEPEPAGVVVEPEPAAVVEPEPAVVELEPAVVEPEPAAVEAVGGNVTAAPAPPATPVPRWFVVVAFAVVVAVVAAGVVAAGRDLSNRRSLSVAGLSLRVPAGWHLRPAPAGKDVAADGPSGQHLELWHQSGATRPDVKALASALRAGVLRPEGATVDPSSVDLVEIRAGLAVVARATFGGRSLSAAVVVPAVASAPVVSVAVYGPAASADATLRAVVGSLSLPNPTS